MKYHYKIRSSFDVTDIPVDSKMFCGLGNNGTDEFEGWGTSEAADKIGTIELIEGQYNPDQYYVQVYPVPENIEDEDILDGHCYPGHETWDDGPEEYDTSEDPNGDRN